MILVLVAVVHGVPTTEYKWPRTGSAPSGCPSCNTTTAFCYANSHNRIGADSQTTLAECCALCCSTADCASFTHWGGKNESGVAHCFLFSTVAGVNHAKDCASGVSGRAPSPSPGPPPQPPPPPASPSGKNFLLFLPDAVRAESLGTYGHPITKTPAFDRLAAQGTLFQQAHTLSTSSSTASRVAMATGRYVHTKNHRTTQHLVQCEFIPQMMGFVVKMMDCLLKMTGL